jgi:hypothetical protein
MQHEWKEAPCDIGQSEPAPTPYTVQWGNDHYENSVMDESQTELIETGFTLVTQYISGSSM